MDCPVQVLWGAEDDWVPPACGQAFADRVAGGALTLVPDAGHLLQENAPEAIVAAVLAPAC